MTTAVPLIKIRYFAMLRESVGRSWETLPLTPGESAAQVYIRLASRYDFSLGLSDLRMAVNEQFVAQDYRLQDGDELALIPPVAGG